MKLSLNDCGDVLLECYDAAEADDLRSDLKAARKAPGTDVVSHLINGDGVIRMIVRVASC
jgi:hypothetical protein